MQHRVFQKPAVHTVYAFVVAAMLSSPFGSVTRADQAVAGDGIVRSKSAYAFGDTVERLTKDVASKGIMLFSVIDQTKLARDAGLSIIPSTLLVFGNPALGTQFIAARPEAGLDWPVRLLVQQDTDGHVWVSYTDFAWIARRHKVRDGEMAFTTASSVIASITSSVAAK
ncbi:MAG: DUF302 domain-containing protein [Rhodospirillales bacterium]|nr:DUF302 domain-containing protein [Rhodospirillales bacterium]